MNAEHEVLTHMAHEPRALSEMELAAPNSPLGSMVQDFKEMARDFSPPDVMEEMAAPAMDTSSYKHFMGEEETTSSASDFVEQLGTIETVVEDNGDKLDVAADEIMKLGAGIQGLAAYIQSLTTEISVLSGRVAELEREAKAQPG